MGESWLSMLLLIGFLKVFTASSFIGGKTQTLVIKIKI